MLRHADLSWFRWGPVVAGGFVAAAISMILTGFGSTLGFSDVTQTWREVTPTLALLAGLWFLAVAFASAAAGGYLAGRARDRWALPQTDETTFRDGVHGLVAWATAVLLGAVITASVASATKTGEPVDPAIPLSSQALGAPTSLLTRDLDRMLLSDRAITNLPLRIAAGRLLTSAATDPKVNPDDRTQLIGFVEAGSGLPAADAQKRVDEAIAAARAQVASAHHAKAVGAFITAASLALAALAAWFAAEIGGRHREDATPPSLLWSPRRIRLIIRAR
jgi:hypothetical protein